MGNLEDITLRVVRVLGQVDLIAAEDTRRSSKLLKHYGIDTPLVSFHQHSSMGKINMLVAAMMEGKNLALLSDAGTPGISDPGQALVQASLAEGIEVDPMPGPCAAITALSASGFPLAAFTFYGFLPKKGLSKTVASFNKIRHPIVLYESPRRISSLLSLLDLHMPEREIFLARELTKIHQQLMRGKPGIILAQIKEQGLERGEFTVVLGPGRNSVTPLLEQLPMLAERGIEEGMTARDLATKISLETGITRREVYSFINNKKDT